MTDDRTGQGLRVAAVEGWGWEATVGQERVVLDIGKEMERDAAGLNGQRGPEE